LRGIVKHACVGYEEGAPLSTDVACMPHLSRRTTPAALALSLMLVGTPPALADLQAGRIAFSAGDFATAFKEFNAVAETSDSSGQYLAGEMLIQGRGVAKDVRRGIALLESSARSGHVGAQSMVGALYAFGQDMPADYAKALSFLRPAAQAGDVHAQNNLAALTYFGLGTPRDIVEALHWAKRASSKRLVAAIKLEQEIESQATPEQIRAAVERMTQPLAPPTPVPGPAPSTQVAAATPKPVTPAPKTEAKPTAPPPAPARTATVSPAAKPAAATPPVAQPVSPPSPPPPPPPPATVAAAPPATTMASVASTPPNTVPIARPVPKPAAPPPPPAPAPAPMASPPPSAGGWVIQVGSLPSREEADKHWKGIAAKQAALLGGRQASMVQADLGAKGIYTRVFLTGFTDQASAAGLCGKLKAAGTDCLVKKGP
jgi:hypothetical protein